MTQESDESQLPLTPVKESNIDELISAYISNLGIPYLCLKYEKVEQISDAEPVAIRYLLDFSSEGGRTPCDTVKEITALNGKAHYRISTHLRPLPPRKQPPLSLFKTEFPEDFSRLVSNDGLWQESSSIIANTSSLAFALDSFARWPAWLLLNTGGPISKLTSSDVNDAVRRLEGEQLGLRREMAEGLFPCKIIRFNQDLIRISRDQLVVESPESVIVDFDLGPAGYQYLNANLPMLDYALWGADNHNLVTEKIALSMDQIKYGIRLPFTSIIPPGQEIRGSSLKLFMGNVLVDKMEGFYIRNIRINIQHS